MDHSAFDLALHRRDKFEGLIQRFDRCGQLGFDNRADPHITSQRHRSGAADFTVVIGLK